MTGLMVNVLFWYLWLVVLLLLHELAHAGAARILGFKLHSISLGYGRQIVDRRILGLRFRINLIPFSGSTLALPQTTIALRRRLWLFVFAGPAVHMLAVLGCYLILGPDFFSNRLFSLSVLSRIAPIEMFIYANLFLLFVNLFSTSVRGPGAKLHSDGYRLVTIPFFHQERLEEYEALYVGIEAIEQIESGNLDKAIAIYENGLTRHPHNYMLRHDLALVRLRQGSYEHARNEFKELLTSREGSKADFRTILLNNIAWVDLLLRNDGLLAEADEYSEQAIKQQPKTTNFVGTRGAVLVRTGRVQEGLTMLKTAFQEHTDKSHRASVSCWIAIGEALLGNTPESTTWLQRAREESPNHYLLSIAENEIQLAGK